MKIALYCNWSVKPSEDGFYLPSIHKKYIDGFRSQNKEGLIVLISNVSAEPATVNDSFVSYSEVGLIPLPKFKTYLSSIFYPHIIIAKLFKASRDCDLFYVKTFEPFSWTLLFFKKKKTIVNFHFLANPIEAIWGNQKDSKFIKTMKTLLFYPEFLLTCYAAFRNKATCNGPSVLNHVPNFLRKRLKILVESSLNESDYTPPSLKIKSAERLNIVSVGALKSAKGFVTIIDGIKLFRDKNPNVNFHLFIAGEGEDRGEIESKIVECDLNNYVTLTGQLKNEELNNLYEAGDVFLFASHSETGPRVILEAMANSLFIITTDVGYVRSVLTLNNELKCQIIEKCSPDSVSKSLDWYLKNKEKAEEMVAEAYLASTKLRLSSFISDILFNHK